MIGKIGYTRPVNTAKIEAKKRASGVSGSSFADLLDGLDSASEASIAEPTSSVAPMAGAGLLLGLQEVSEDEIHQRKAFKQGRNAIDVLESLRDGLLTGRLSHSIIANLESVVAQERTKTTDPKLNAILDDIEVRIAVELAKLERARM